MVAPWKQKATKTQFDDSDLPPEGNQPAVCIALIDIGTHTNEYQGTKTTNRKVYMVWELVEADGKPVIGKDFTLSLHEKALLRDFVKKWRGKDLDEGQEFDISKLVGQPCNLLVVHKTSGERKYAKVDGVSVVVKGQQIGKPSRNTLLWSLDEGDVSKLPDWLPYLYGQPISEWVKNCHERTGKSAADSEGGDTDEKEMEPAAKEDGIPF